MKASVIERGSALNKALSVLMALVLAVSLAPLPAYAETPGEPAPEQEQQLDPAPETPGEPVVEKQGEPNADSPAKPATMPVEPKADSPVELATMPVEPKADSPVELVGASSSSPAEQVNTTVPELADSGMGDSVTPEITIQGENDPQTERTLQLIWSPEPTDYTNIDMITVELKGPASDMPVQGSVALSVDAIDKDAVRSMLEAEYDGVTDNAVVDVWTLQVTNADGSAYNMPESLSVSCLRFCKQAMGKELGDAPDAYTFDGASFALLERNDVVAVSSSGVSTWQFDIHPGALGTFALVDVSGLTEKAVTGTATYYDLYGTTNFEFLSVGVSGPVDLLPSQSDVSVSVVPQDITAIRTILENSYTGVSDSTIESVYRVALVDKTGHEVELPKGIEITSVTYERYDIFGTGLAVAPDLYAYSDGALTEIKKENYQELEVSGTSLYRFDIRSTVPGVIALLHTDGLTEKKSENGLAPGVYTADVNIYVPASQAPIGQKVYVTDDGFPPITYRTQNGQIEVKEDGTAVVTAYVRQPVFWVEQISSGDKVKVLNTEFSGDLGKNYDGYTTRIVRVEAEVSEPEFTGNREYQFGDCIQYATPFNFAANWDMWLQVDYDSAVVGAYEPPVDAAWSYTYNDLASGASLTVSTDDEALGAQLASFSFTGRKVVDDSSLSSIKGAFETGYSHVPDYVAYDFMLVDASGDPVNLGDAAVSIMLPGAAILNDGNQELLKVYRYGDGELESLNRVVQDGSIIIPTASLGVVVATDGWEAPWTSKVYVVGEPEVTATFRTASQWDASLMNYIEFNARKETVGGKSVYDFEYVVNADYLSEADSFYKSLRQGYIDHGKSTDEASSLAMADWIGLGGNLYGFTYGLQSEFLITVPVDNADDRVVLVYNNGTSPVAYELPSTYDNGKVTVKIDGDTPVFASTEHVATEYYVNDLGYKQPYFITPATGLAFAYLNGAASATAERPTVYLQVISVEERTVAEPQTLSTPTYNGGRQSGVSIDENCEVVSGNASAVDSGSYNVTVAPKEGYTWLDGAKGEKAVSWRIAEAKLTATYTSEEIKAGETPKLGVSVVGFVNGETAETAAGYVAPTVALPSELEAGKSYELKPANGQAKNYTFTYVPGTLSVKAASAPATEERLKPGTYTVTANVWLNAADADSAGFPILAQIAGAEGGAYMTNATNPNGAEGGATGVPTSPVSDNATLVVADDGALTLTVPIANPVFTMQKLGTNASLGSMSYTTKAGSYGNYQSRIDSITVTLPSAEDATYVLAGSAFHPTILASQYPTAITVPLRLTVGGLGDLPTTIVSDTVKTTDAAITAKGAVTASGSAEAFTVPADLAAKGGATVELVVEDRTAADAAALQKVYASQVGSREVAAVYEVDLEVLNAAGQAVGEKTEGVGALRLTLPVGTLHAGRTVRVVQLHKKASGQPVSEVITYDGLVVGADGTVGFTVKGGKLSEFIVALEPVSATNGTTSGTTGGNAATADNNAAAGDAGGTAAGAAAAGTVQTTSDGRFAAGTYTVSANIWVNKETSGLPLQPHFTSAAFPPMNPVAGNATLRVDGNGRAYLTVPIVIQSRVMQVRSISGLPIVDYSSSDDGLTSITLDLGVLSASDTVVTRSCTASVHLGDLAASIIGGERDRTWAATFQMNFTGLPSSGGGEVPAAVQAMIDAAGSDGRAADADAAAAAAKASALGALTKNLRPQRAYADDGSADPSAPAQQGSFPWAPVAGGVAVAAIAGVAGYLLGSRRKRDMRRAG